MGQEGAAPAQRLWEGESPVLLSNHLDTQQHRDSSREDGRNNTRLGAEPGVEQVVQGEPGQLSEAHRDWDRDKWAQDTSTMRDL